MQAYSEIIPFQNAQTLDPFAAFLAISRNTLVRHWRSLFTRGLFFLSCLAIIGLTVSFLISHDVRLMQHIALTSAFALWLCLLVPFVVILEETFHTWAIIRKDLLKHLEGTEIVSLLWRNTLFSLKRVRICMSGGLTPIDMLHIAFAGPAGALLSYSLVLCLVGFIYPFWESPSQTVLFISPVAIPIRSIIAKDEKSDGAKIRQATQKLKLSLWDLNLQLVYSIYLAVACLFRSFRVSRTRDKPYKPQEKN